MSTQENKLSSERAYSAPNIVAIITALVIGISFTYIFKKFIFELYISKHKYPDYGPSLFFGGQPNMLLYLYVVLIIVSTIVGWVLIWRKIFLDIFIKDSCWRLIAFFSGIVLVFSITVGVGLMGRNLFTPHVQMSCLVLAIGIVIAAYYYFGMLDKYFTYSRSLNLTGLIFFSIFTVISLMNLQKFYILNEIFEQSGMKYPALGLMWGLIILAAGCGVSLPKCRKINVRIFLALILVMIYFMSIRESWVFWSLDAFHEGESFLTVPLLIGGGKELAKEFLPTHGLGRNIIHSYYASLFSNSNLYFSRIIQALTYPFVHVLVAANLYRYSKSLLVPVVFFVLIYFFGMFEERDISPFLLLTLLLVPLNETVNKANLFFRIITGIALFFSAIYSYEYFIFVNIAMIFTLGHYLLSYRLTSEKGVFPWIHISYFICLFLFFIILGTKTLYWIDVVVGALLKSPNLLQRPLDIPLSFSLNFFLISIFFALFLLFFLTQLVVFLCSQSHKFISIDSVVIIITIVSLMFFVRAFNRSDYEHLLYAFAISMPVIIALAMHFHLISLRAFCYTGLILLSAFVINGLMMKTLSLDTLRQRSNYDVRLKRTDIRPIEEFGAMLVPAGSINDTQMTKDELASLKALVGSGFKLFDMTNQPMLFYGAVGSPLLTNDIHTLFYNTYEEQQDVIRRLSNTDKVVVIWSSNHWSEKLDTTYTEYRLPLLSAFILDNYKKSYKEGRFVLLSKNYLPTLKEVNLLSLPTNYQLGYSPSRMSPYKQEKVYTLVKDHVGPSNGLLSPGAVIVNVSAKEHGNILLLVKSMGKVVSEIGFKVPAGNSQNFVRLNNIPNYVHSEMHDISVVPDNAGLKVTSLNYLSLTDPLP